MDFKMSLSECKLHKIHIVLVLIWIYVAGVINADNYFTSNSEIFNSVPTTIKTNENDTVLLPCSPTGEYFDMLHVFMMFFSTIYNGKQRFKVKYNFSFQPIF